MKIKIKAKNRKDKFKAFLLEKECEEWLKQNKDMMKDYMNLVNDVMLFKAKWGIPVELRIGELEELKEYRLGKLKNMEI
jgi:hypothetical protein